MVGWIVCAGFTMRLRISLTTCPPSQRKRAWEKKWSAASKGSFKNSGLRHRSVCPPDSHHPCLLQSVHLFVDMSRFPSSMLTTVCLTCLDRSRFPSSMFATVCWYFQIPIIHAHYSLSTCFDRSRFPSSMLTTICPLVLTGPDSLHPCSQQSIDIFRFPSSMLATVCPPVCPYMSLWLCVLSSCVH